MKKKKKAKISSPRNHYISKLYTRTYFGIVRIEVEILVFCMQQTQTIEKILKSFLMNI
jgi:hypothetical protein